MRDINKFHAVFYAVAEKMKQDAFIPKFCRASNLKRRRKQVPEKFKSTTIEYTIPNVADVNLKVCRDTRGLLTEMLNRLLKIMLSEFVYGVTALLVAIMMQVLLLPHPHLQRLSCLVVILNQLCNAHAVPIILSMTCTLVIIGF